MAAGSELGFLTLEGIEGVETPKIIEWEDLQQELARLWSLSSALKKAKERKESLAQKLESIIEVGFFGFCCPDFNVKVACFCSLSEDWIG